jgi:anti-sigma28 factor (negative regulator of flagellin synthesis)
MIDKVNLNRLIGQALETEKRVRKKETPGVSEVQRQEDVVEISKAAREALRTDYEDLSRKVAEIKEQIARGEYEVNTEKIVEGLRKFLV